MTDQFLTMVETKRLLQLSDLRRYRDNAQSRHRMVMGLFPQDLGDDARGNAGILFRVERNSKGGFVLIRSSIAPVALSGVNSLRERYSHVEGDTVMFRLTLNPVKRKGSKERFITGDEELEGYLHEKVSPFFESVEVVSMKSESLLRANKGRDFLPLTQFDGVATIGNLNDLNEALTNGIGRAKNYGAGLLTVRAV